MEFLGIGPLELMFILLIILLVIGPRDMAKTGRKVGHLLNQLYRSESWKIFNEASRTLRTLPNRLAREASLEELDAVRKSVQETSDQISREMQDIDEGLKAWTASPRAQDDQSSSTNGESTSSP